MSCNVAVYARTRTAWWRRVAEAVSALTPEIEMEYFDNLDECAAASCGAASEPVLLLVLERAADVEKLVVLKEWLQDKEVMVVLASRAREHEAVAYEIRPRVIITDSVPPVEAAEAVRRIHDRARWRLSRWNWEKEGANSSKEGL